MTGWLARAAAHFAKSPPTPTDKTDETPLSSVSSVGVPPLSEDFDPRVTCVTCRHYLAAVHVCRNHKAALLQARDIAPALAVLKQNCFGWKGEPSSPNSNLAALDEVQRLLKPLEPETGPDEAELFLGAFHGRVAP